MVDGVIPQRSLWLMGECMSQVAHVRRTDLKHDARGILREAAIILQRCCMLLTDSAHLAHAACKVEGLHGFQGAALRCLNFSALSYAEQHDGCDERKEEGRQAIAAVLRGE